MPLIVELPDEYSHENKEKQFSDTEDAPTMTENVNLDMGDVIHAGTTTCNIPVLTEHSLISGTKIEGESLNIKEDCVDGVGNQTDICWQQSKAQKRDGAFDSKEHEGGECVTGKTATLSKMEDDCLLKENNAIFTRDSDETNMLEMSTINSRSSHPSHCVSFGDNVLLSEENSAYVSSNESFGTVDFTARDTVIAEDKPTKQENVLFTSNRSSCDKELMVADNTSAKGDAESNSLHANGLKEYKLPVANSICLAGKSEVTSESESVCESGQELQKSARKLGDNNIPVSDKLFYLF